MLFERLRRVLASVLGRTPAEGTPDEGTALFRQRYLSFRLLLAANNTALDTMAEMEQAALGERIFGTSFVQSRCTAVGVNVYKMVQNLDALAPGKYGELFDVLEEIQGKIRSLLVTHRSASDAPLVMAMAEIDRRWVDSVGLKVANLGEVANVVGLPVPPGFAVTSRAFTAFLEHNELQPEIDRLIQISEGDQTADLFALSSRLQQLVIHAEPPPTLVEAMDAAYRRLAEATGSRPLMAVRSSAVGEDSPEASFAGQYRTELNVQPEHLLDAYREVVASKYSPQAIQYRLERGLRDDELSMCVGCIAMVNARAGGVAYTGNPGDASDVDVHISAAFGLPKAVVDGASADEFVVRREPPLEVIARHVVFKDELLVPDPVEGVARGSLSEDDRENPAISDEEAVRVARAALRLEEHYGWPQDVEWAIDASGEVVVLQSRPLRQVQAGRHPGTPPIGAEKLLSGGICVSPGAAAGPVCRVDRDADALRFPEGAVLVLRQPQPRWAALLGRASAVLAGRGGSAGHLATVARELGLPGVFSVPNLDSLEEGTVVTVNADDRAVFSGEIRPLLDNRPERPCLMAGSPVHDLLTRTLEHIAPLNLLDPDDVAFRPSSCRTLHDITRFCHEQSVREMFAFGKEHRFPKHESKQLHHNVPMQWWVLNLEDGFSGDVTGKYVTLDQIACRPMLALWHGMVAIPWDGPPAMSGRGFASVLFEATANPALATPFRKPYAQRNYFMISKTFMNLQSRFGFHFAAVEAVVGDRDRENYLSFSFKGGAADFERRSARVRFLGELLEEHGFEVRGREDTASARLAGLPAGETADRIEIIGYLLMHTRQLDMIMADPATVALYRDKMRRDITSLINGETPGPATG